MMGERRTLMEKYEKCIHIKQQENKLTNQSQQQRMTMIHHRIGILWKTKDIFQRPCHCVSFNGCSDWFVSSNETDSQLNC